MMRLTMTTTLGTLVALAFLCGACSAQTTLYVAPDGDDADPGTRAQPLASIARAQALVRERIAGGLEDNVVVRINHGVYELSEPLRFGPEDSAPEGRWIMYAGEPGGNVVLSGGRRISGWTAGEDGVWTAHVPGVAEGDWQFRQLYVNGLRAVRARTPNADGDPPCGALQDAQLPESLEYFRLTFEPGVLKPWEDVAEVEVAVKGDWGISRQRIQEIDETAGVASIAPPYVAYSKHRWNRPGKGRRYFLENSRTFLDRPGEWHLNRDTGVLSYMPREGEDMANADVVAPVATRLIEMVGSAENPVQRLHFRGLQFRNTGWSMPGGSYNGMQACKYTKDNDGIGAEMVEAAVHGEYVRGCSIVGCDLANIGGSGLFLATGCAQNIIEGCKVFDVGGNGIMVGGEDTPEKVNWSNRIAHNHVSQCGAELYGAVGIWVGFARETHVAHNLVHDVPYTGISVGWCWAPIPTQVRANTIEYNHIHHVMRELGDGGGIYTLGWQPGTVIRGNVIHDVDRNAYAHGAPNNGMFIDEGSKGFLFERNLIYGTAGAPIRFNQCAWDWHTWADNSLAVIRSAEGRIGRALVADGSSSKIDVPHSDALEPQELTAEAWVYMDERQAGHDARKWIVSKNTNEWAEGHYGLVVSDQYVTAYMNIGGGQENWHSASSESPLSLNAWHHLAMTYDSAVLRLYADGEQVASAEINKPRVPSTGFLRIGGRPDNYTFFRGIIDEVRLHSRALAGEEIAERYARPEAFGSEEPGAVEGLVLAESFEELEDTGWLIEEAMGKAGPQPPYRDRVMQSP